MRWLAALALLLAPGLALADPITIVATLAPYIGGTLAAAAASVAVFASTYGGYILAAYSVYGGIQARRKAKRQAAAARRAYNESLTDRTITTLQASPPLRVVYGRAIVGGDIVAILTSDKTGLRDNGSTYTKPDALKHLVIVLAAHECEDVHELYIDGIAVGTLDGSGWATTGEFGGEARKIYQERTLAAGASATFDSVPTVLSAGYMATGDGGWVDTTYSVVGNTVTNTSGFAASISVELTVSQGTVRWEKHLGTADQLASSYLQGVAPSEWTSDDRLRGLAYVVMTLDLEEARFQGGPPPLTFGVSGRLVYDPRSTATAYSENPALVIRDWLTAEWGFGVYAADLDDASIIAAANACDASISLTVGGDTTSGATYTCNGATTTDAAPESVLEELAQSMAGLVTHTGGLWLVNAGTYTAPVLALTEDMQAGAIEVVQAGTAYADLFNGMRGRMIERGRAVESDIDPYSNAAYVTDDGDELWNDITLPWTDNRARARNLVRIFTEQSRESLVIRYPAQLHAWPLQVGDRVTVTSTEYAWAAKVFRVTDWQWSDQSAVLLTLQEDGAAIYDLADAATADQLPNTGLPNPYSVPGITGATAESGTDHVLAQGDGSIVPRVWVSWDAVASAYVTQGGRIEIRWRRIAVDSINEWRTVNAPGSATGEYLLGAAAGDRITIGLRAVNGLGAAGTEVFISHSVVGDITPPAAASGLAYETVIGGMNVWWDDSPARDYDYSELRQGVSWAAGAELFKGRGNTTTWYPPSDGSYMLWLVHYDRTGNPSTPVSLATTYTAIGGTPGGNSATVYLYQRTASSSAPALPAVSLTYDFVTGDLSGGSLGAWSLNIPAAGAGSYLHVTKARAYSTSSTFNIPPGAWQAAQILAQDGEPGEPGEPGDPGLSGTQVASAYLYQWASSAPPDPSGSSTWTWASGNNSAYTGAGGWATAVPTNPGTPGIQLWVCSKAVTAVAGATNTAVSWASGFSKYAVSGNGATGTPGVQVAQPTLWRWALSIPTISGSNGYTWATGAITGTLPESWTATPGSGTPGQTLWAASRGVVGAAGDVSASIDWTSASITARGYAGDDGDPGDPGPAGISARRAYTLTTLSSLGSGTVTSSGISSLPAAGSFGAGTWAASPSTPAAGEVLYQSDGLYNPATNTTTWEAPYISALKVGQLSALAVNTGGLTVNGDLALSSAGAIRSGKSSFADTTAGIYLGYDGGTHRFSIGNAATSLTWNGSVLAVNGAALVAATGTFGAVTATSSVTVGSGAARAYVRSDGKDFANNVSGFIFDRLADGTVRAEIGQASGSYLRWNTTGVLEVKGAVVTGGTITNPDLTLPGISASLSGGGSSSVAAGGTAARTVTIGTPTGGKSPYTYKWSSILQDQYGTVSRVQVTGSTGTSCPCSMTSTGSGFVSLDVSCVVTDANGLTKTVTTSVNLTVGSPVAP